jgi:Fe2+ transport system protein B
MFMLGILFLLAGMVLAQRFKILILTLAILLTLPCIVSVGIIVGETPRLIGLGAAIAVVCLQTGYMVGIVLRHLLLSAHIDRVPSTSSDSSSPARSEYQL